MGHSTFVVILTVDQFQTLPSSTWHGTVAVVVVDVAAVGVVVVVAVGFCHWYVIKLISNTTTVIRWLLVENGGGGGWGIGGRVVVPS